MPTKMSWRKGMNMYYQTEKDLIIVKVGTNVLTDISEDREILNTQAFDRIGREVRALSDAGMGIILVSSGAITAGVLGDNRRRQDVDNMYDLQRYAARGWDQVVQQWKRSIGGERVSSTLLTKREIHTEAMRTKALGVMSCCLSYNDVFVVNENDTISDDEIKFGDNDTLAAALAVECERSKLFRSVRLVLLTNIDGLRVHKDDAATILREVDDIAQVERYAGAAANEHSRGGMVTKVQAAKVATRAGVATYIADGRMQDAVREVLDHKIGTYFAINRTE